MSKKQNCFNAMLRDERRPNKFPWTLFLRRRVACSVATRPLLLAAMQWLNAVLVFEVDEGPLTCPPEETTRETNGSFWLIATFVPSQSPRETEREKKNSKRSLAALALAAMASAFAALASAQPTSVTGLIQQIPVVGTQIKPCPPVGFDSLPNFDLTAYVSAPWYIQQQVRRFERPEEGTHDRGGEWGGRF